MNTTCVMKIFQIDDMEWWIGADAESVKAAVIEAYGHSDEDLEYFQELTDDALDNLKVTDAEEHEWPFFRTFRDLLAIEVAEGGDFPRMFAVENW